MVHHLFDHHKNDIHKQNLEYLVELTDIVKNTCRIIAVKQRPWVKSYLDFNTYKRKDATTELERNFLKPMNNSVFGNTMEKMNNVMEIKLTTKPNTTMNHFPKPPFKQTHDILMVCIWYNSIKKEYYTTSRSMSDAVF